MKPTMIIPAAGLSTRYGLARPKFLLQHPEGRSMLAAGVAQLPGEEFSEALVVSLRGFLEGLDADAVSGEIAEALLDDPEAPLLAEILSSTRRRAEGGEAPAGGPTPPGASDWLLDPSCDEIPSLLLTPHGS